MAGLGYHPERGLSLTHLSTCHWLPAFVKAKIAIFFSWKVPFFFLNYNIAHPDLVSITVVNIVLSPEGEVRSSLFSEMPWRLHLFFNFSLFLTEYLITDSIFTRRLSFFGGKSIREYFMGKSGAFCGLF